MLEEYLQNVTERVYIRKGKVDKVDKKNHTINVKFYDGTGKETDKILANVKVPFIFGLNDENIDDLDCLVALPYINPTDSYCICFFSKNPRFHITLDKTTLELKDNKIKIDIDEKFGLEATNESLSLTMGEKLKINLEEDNVTIKTSDTTEIKMAKSKIELKAGDGSIEIG
jgi:hypothetical protein